MYEFGGHSCAMFDQKFESLVCLHVIHHEYECTVLGSYDSAHAFDSCMNECSVASPIHCFSMTCMCEKR